MRYNNLTDNELWTEIMKDDTKAFAVLFDRYWSKLFTTAFHHLKDAEVCTEVVQDIFLNIWIKRQDLVILSFPNYLTAASRYHVLKHVRSIKKSPIILKEDLEKNIAAKCDNEGDDKLIYVELEMQVYGHVKKLPKRCQEIFILSRKEHFTNEQIAHMLGISKRSVENQITYALQHLRLSMKELFIIGVISFVG